MQYFEHSLYGAFPKYKEFPLSVRELFAANNIRLNPENGLLYVQIVRSRSARVLTFVGGTIQEYEFDHWQHLFLSFTFKSFPVWFLCGSRSNNSSLIQEINKTPARLTCASRVLGTRELRKF